MKMLIECRVDIDPYLLLCRQIPDGFHVSTKLTFSVGQLACDTAEELAGLVEEAIKAEMQKVSQERIREAADFVI